MHVTKISQYVSLPKVKFFCWKELLIASPLPLLACECVLFSSKSCIVPKLLKLPCVSCALRIIFCSIHVLMYYTGISNVRELWSGLNLSIYVFSMSLWRMLLTDNNFYFPPVHFVSGVNSKSTCYWTSKLFLYTLYVEVPHSDKTQPFFTAWPKSRDHSTIHSPIIPWPGWVLQYWGRGDWITNWWFSASYTPWRMHHRHQNLCVPVPADVSFSPHLDLESC